MAVVFKRWILFYMLFCILLFIRNNKYREKPLTERDSCSSDLFSYMVVLYPMVCVS